MKKTLLILGFLFCIITTSKAQVVGTEIGDIAPEIDLPDAKGNTVSLSSLRGGLVLIDFWATWCGPCIKEQPELLKLYTASAGKLDIYGISLDKSKPSWTATNAKLKLPWSQVNDFKYWSTQPAKDYMVQALPFNVLIDKNGIILAKNIHGNALNERIKSLLASQ